MFLHSFLHEVRRTLMLGICKDYFLYSTFFCFYLLIVICLDMNDFYNRQFVLRHLFTIPLLSLFYYFL